MNRGHIGGMHGYWGGPNRLPIMDRNWSRMESGRQKWDERPVCVCAPGFTVTLGEEAENGR